MERKVVSSKHAEMRALTERAKMVRIHNKPEHFKPGAKLRFSKGVYERQANGSLKRIG
jgi:hypothetical protein